MLIFDLTSWYLSERTHITHYINVYLYNYNLKTQLNIQRHAHNELILSITTDITNIVTDSSWEDEICERMFCGG